MARVVRYRSEVQNPPSGPVLMSSADVDGYLERLVKYIPGEVLALFTPIAGLLATQDPEPTTLLWVVFIAGIVATPLWLYVTALQGPRSPKRYLYLLAPIAFIVWAINVNAGMAGLIGVDGSTAAVILFLAVLFIPALDLIIDFRT